MRFTPQIATSDTVGAVLAVIASVEITRIMARKRPETVRQMSTLYTFIALIRLSEIIRIDSIPGFSHATTEIRVFTGRCPDTHVTILIFVRVIGVVAIFTFGIDNSERWNIFYERCDLRKKI